MKIELETSSAVPLLTRLKAIARCKSAMPVLGCVLIETKPGGVTFTVSDLDRHLAMTITCVVHQPGKALVACARLCDALAKIAGATAVLEAGKGALAIASGEWSCKLLTLAPDEFPEMPSAKNAKEGRIEHGALVRLLKLSGHFVSRDQTRFVLNGVRIRSIEGGAESAATDGRRLLVLEAPGADWPGDLIIPSDAARVLAGLPGADAGEEVAMVTLELTEHALFVETENWRFCTKLVEGNFPNVGAVIPTKDTCKNKVTVSRRELLEALPFVEAVASAHNESVRLEPSAGRLKVRVNTPEVGEACAPIAASLSGAPEAFALNGSFFAELLAVMAGGDATFQLGTAIDPVMVEEPGFLAVLMPMRVN